MLVYNCVRIKYLSQVFCQKHEDMHIHEALKEIFNYQNSIDLVHTRDRRDSQNL
jgi:hypothetical protein